MFVSDGDDLQAALAQRASEMKVLKPCFKKVPPGRGKLCTTCQRSYGTVVALTASRQELSDIVNGDTGSG